ncbi:MAG TPA: methyltransferase [Sphingomicrobium sp.]|nr:methyltransferase [Sphingomicrobium sp.]
MRTLTLTLALAAIAVAGCNKAEPPHAFSQAALDKALADPARKSQADAADARRKPGPLIALAGVAPGDKVLDLIPGSGYWTRIFSKVVGPEGKVYAVWPQAYARFAMGNVADLKKLSADYGNIVTEVQPSAVLSAPELLDVVWTSQNYHDYPDEYMGKDADPDLLNKAVFKILKPGGTYMIIDHMAKAGRGMADTEKLHRIDPATVRRQVEAAGFKFAGESKVLNNPEDPLDIPVFDKSIRGRTSQFAYRFVKPS